MASEVHNFRTWMAEQNLAESTTEVYAKMVGFGLRRGDVLLAARRARTSGSLKVAASALRLWCRWKRDRRLLSRVDRVIRRRSKRTGATVVRYITEEERETLLQTTRRLEEPYKSAMTLVIGSRLKLATILKLSRIQVEVGCTERVPIIGPHKDVIGLWLPPPEVRAAFRVLTQYGDWSHVQELFGRDYQHTYHQLRALLHYVCRKAGTRQVKPSELGLPGSPVQATMLDEEARCA